MRRLNWRRRGNQLEGSEIGNQSEKKDGWEEGSKQVLSGRLRSVKVASDKETGISRWRSEWEICFPWTFAATPVEISTKGSKFNIPMEDVVGHVTFLSNFYFSTFHFSFLFFARFTIWVIFFRFLILYQQLLFSDWNISLFHKLYLWVRFTLMWICGVWWIN